MRDQAPIVCFLMETRLDKEGFANYGRELPFPNKFIVKKPFFGGGLAWLWKSEVQLEVINFIDNHILAKVVEDDGFTWFLTRFYGWPEASEKRSLGLFYHISPLLWMGCGVVLETST